jgi:NAD(P)-dependent dehydrogenase (short-subunit alcohol dehydrogenase family)
MQSDPNHKVVLVTGATSGIGRATALRFAETGAFVAAVGRNEDALRETIQQIREVGGEGLSLRAELADEGAPQQVIAQTLKRWDRLNVLVNAAGHISSGTIESAVPALIETKGSIVNVSSVTGLRAFPGVLAYCVSKAGVDQLTRCAALELAAKGVRVNAVNPGVVVTEIHRRGGMNSDQYETFLERSKQTHPLGRVGDAREVAELIHFLASDKAAWITGATYSIDGGRAQTCAR